MLTLRTAPVSSFGVLLAVLGASAVVGCSGPPAVMTPDASFRCASSADCDDGAACTVDTCSAAGMCNYNPIDAMCPAGQHCQVGTGCTSETFCMTDAMCDDTFDCTTDACVIGNTCSHTAIDALCTVPGMNVCDLRMGCIAGSTTTCTSAADCDDEISCTLDSCGADAQCRNTAMDSLCTGTDEICDATLGCRVRHGCAVAADCTEFYNFCDGDPTCDPEFGCQPPPTPRACNDANACTLDACDPTAGERGACTTACDRSMTACATTEPLCAVSGPTCSGVFDVTGPNLTGSCAFTMLQWDFTRLTFENTDGLALTVTPRRLTTMGVGALTLNDAAAPVCPMFTATATVTGACEEHYEISGMFSDDDTVSGTVSIHFMDEDGFTCSFASCVDVTSTFSGTRM